MSRLEELINELCPDGVEYKKLKDLSTIISSPKKIKSNEYKEKGKYKIVDQGQSFVAGYTDDESSLFPLFQYVIFGDHTEIINYSSR